MAQGSPARLTPGEGRKFAFTLAAAFGVLAALLWWRGRPTASLVLAVVAAAFLAGGLLVPGSLGPVYRAWMGFALAISKVTTPIFMGLVYFVVITPIAVLRRAIGGNPLRAHQGASGWVDRQQGPRGDLTRQF
ncbi:MAG TPA: SxtJ family membrane protein [Gemmatimonadales bacterium]|nr:SxtJ family membrane protein [Gemmatimonadales bacterium]